MTATAQYLRIVVNAERRYGLWPFARPIPRGWADTCFVGSRLRCLAQITELTRRHGTDAVPGDAGRTATGRLALVTALAPDRAAVLGCGRRLTHAALDRRADALARTFAEHGVRRGDVVGLRLRAGADAVVARLAVLKTAAAYLPMPDQPGPPPRPGLRLIVAEPEWAGPARRSGLPVLAWHRRDAVGRRPLSRAGRAVGSGDAAFVVPGPAPGGGLVFDHGRLVQAATAAQAAGGPLPAGGPAEVSGPSPECEELVLWGRLLHGYPVTYDGHTIAGLSEADDPAALDARWYVLDDDLRPAPEGQLYLAAAWLGRTYDGGPTRSARWLWPDPFDPVGGATMLWTGHRARRENGVLRLTDR